MESRYLGRSPVFLLLFMLISCFAVKENRQQCPCTLHLCVEGVKAPSVVEISIGDYYRRVAVGSDTLLHEQVPRGDVLAAAFSGKSEVAITGLSEKDAGGFPPFCAGAAIVHAESDEVHSKIEILKHYCTLQVTMAGSDSSDAAQGAMGVPFHLRVRGGVDSVSAFGEPHSGEFVCLVAPGGTVRIPRQPPSSPLLLEVLSSEGEVVRSFSLGSYLLEAGYDWRAPNLADVSILLSLSLSSLTLSLEYPVNLDNRDVRI